MELYNLILIFTLLVSIILFLIIILSIQVYQLCTQDKQVQQAKLVVSTKQIPSLESKEDDSGNSKPSCSKVACVDGDGTGRQVSHRTYPKYVEAELDKANTKQRPHEPRGILFWTKKVNLKKKYRIDWRAGEDKPDICTAKSFKTLEENNFYQVGQQCKICVEDNESTVASTSATPTYRSSPESAITSSTPIEMKALAGRTKDSGIVVERSPPNSQYSNRMLMQTINDEIDRSFDRLHTHFNFSLSP